MLKVVVFCSSTSLITSNILLNNLLHQVKSRGDVEIELIVEASRQPNRGGLLKSMKLYLNKIVAKIFNPELILPFKAIIYSNIYAIARKHGYMISVPYNSDINSDKFLDSLENRFQDSVALVIGCPQIFEPRLIGMFKMAINYHNSFLPHYRGLSATSWAYFHGEKSTGFSFHTITEKIDEGNLLHQGKVPIDLTRSQMFHEVVKAEQAAKVLPEILDGIKLNYQGEIQIGDGSYFGKTERKALVNIEDSTKITFYEIQRILRSFNVINLTIYGVKYPVTKVIEVDQLNSSKWAFMTKDEKRLRVIRIKYLPPFIYNLISNIIA